MLYGLCILFPMVGGILISILLNDDKLPADRKAGIRRKRNRCYAALMLLTDLICALSMASRPGGVSFPIVGKAGIAFLPDTFGMVMMTLILTVYTLILFYSFSYMESEEREEIFFGFYFSSLGALIAVCLSGNLITLYAFFELATLSSMPLVLHEMDAKSVSAGKKYLFYSIGGALMGLACITMIYYLCGEQVLFTYGGFMSPEMIAGHEPVFFALVLLGIVGFGTKAGIWPMHGWLPTAHPIAPAPASALMSGIIAKAGVIALVRMIYFAIGPSLLRDTWVQRTWTVLCMITVLLGSSMAFMEKELKKRLAYSTVSQISYILLGLSLLSMTGLWGGLLQLFAHACAKGTLFLCAGMIIKRTGLRQVKDLSGIGKKLPLTMWLFFFAALSLVGIWPMGGFLAKWTLAQGTLESTKGFFAIAPVVVLLISAMLTAGYLLPVVIGGFFPGKEAKDQETERIKEPLLMLIPMAILCAGSLITGLFGYDILALLHF
ncbi:MAG: proton-conducting membrane transporter [Lachnospiraceae bacterium]|nr:proton-conducting membrane transporter [Lachnospiraceae bacterium]